LRPDGRLPEATESLLARFPSLHVMGIALDGRRVTVRSVGQPAEQTLIDAAFDELIRILQGVSP
jgi:hypothetical protein